MSEAPAIHQTGRGNSGFSKLTILGIILFGFCAFMAMIYFIGAGDTGDRSGNGQAHAASNSLVGYGALVRLLELEGANVSRSRSQSDLETQDLLVLTPRADIDVEDLTAIIESRAYLGPTMVILPKWLSVGIPPELFEQVEQEVGEDWVHLIGPQESALAQELPEPYKMKVAAKPSADAPTNWAGLGLNGVLPSDSAIGATDFGDGTALVVDQSSAALALWHYSEDEFGNSQDTEAVTFVLEPDLMNNYGLSDENRAALALRLIDDARYDSDIPIVFDLTLHGLGGTTNLLTLAFRPPFLAATLCLILALLIVGWRAFKRFGPPIANARNIAFGKRRLVANGAELIVRAKRFGILSDPYIALSARRIAYRLGISKPDHEAIDQALESRFPGDLSFSNAASNLNAATKPTEILRAARALRQIEGKLEK
ncbi:MAG: DUF4350 domain-containing protein [Erythrobacter sp.]